MAGTHWGITLGTGAYIATGPTYTEAATIVSDQKVIQGLQYLPTYAVVTPTMLIATAASHLLEIMAGSSLNVYVRRIRIWQAAMAGAIAICSMSVFRLTSAGTGGGVVTPTPLDPADAASGATAMTLPSSKGTEGVSMSARDMVVLAALPTTGGTSSLIAEWDWGDDLSKMLKIAAGTSNGIAVKDVSGVATASVYIEAEIIEAAF